jgi:hypothetical protein
VEKHPIGYPRFAAFLDNDESFMIYRRFGFLSNRLLLDQQDQLRLLEQELDELDQEDEENNPICNSTRDVPAEYSLERRELLERVEREYCKYGNYDPLEWSGPC